MSKKLFLPKEKHWNWKGGGDKRICFFCRKIFIKRSKESYERFNSRKYCCKICSEKHIVRERHYNWRGGVRKANADGYLRDSITQKIVHRQVMENFLNRPILHSEIVHHKNGDVTDNRLENLEIHSISSHIKMHNKSYKRDSKGRYSNG